jgi:hypothetical protein
MGHEKTFADAHQKIHKCLKGARSNNVSNLSILSSVNFKVGVTV